MSRVGPSCALLLLLSVLCYSVESCVQRHVRAQVPETLQAGYAVSRVNLEGCGIKRLQLASSDPDFTIQTDGTILTVSITTVPDSGKSFCIWVQDQRGHKWKVDVSLTPTEQISQKSSNVVLRRAKRRWSPLPFNIKENDPGPFPKDVEFIASDSSLNFSVYYTIDGPGVTTELVGLFSVVPNSGLLRVHQTVDREMYPQFVFTAHAFDRYSNKETDLPLKITVNVNDVNDNAPQFSSPLFFIVPEQSDPGTIVGQVNATDRDEPNTPHTKIRYTLINGTDLFNINPFSGVITTKTNTLDRETQDRYIVKVEIRDMGGASDGLFSQGLASISLGDINDNPPIFKEKAYKAQVQENQANVLVLRIPVEDKDLQGTPNWKAVYEITKGNETGNFWIKTDPTTNEGLLYVTKPLDREKQDLVKLEIMARNEVPLVQSSSSWMKVPVDLTVTDVDEGPEFSAPILRLKVKENVANGTLIGTYTAIDPETKSSKGIKYYKLTDPGSWINVMETTGELRTANTIDRESPLVYNETYNITVKAVDESQKTGTGTVVILIEDVNDNYPVIPVPDRTVCSKENQRSSTTVEAVDSDKSPYAGPFTFELGPGNDGKWKIKDPKPGTSVVLEQAEDLPNGQYKVPLIVKDLQGEGTEQTVNIQVCTCVRDGECAAQKISAKLGVWAVLAMLLALLLLLLLCLLFVLVCSTKGEKLRMTDDYDGTGGMLLKSNTEAPGEEVKDTLLVMPGSGVDIVDGSKGGATMEHQTMLGTAGGAYGQHAIHGGSMYQTGTQGYMTNQSMFSSGQYGAGFYGNTMYNKFSDMSALDTWRTNELYLDNKLAYFGEEEDGRYAADLLKAYGYEGMGSPAGSVGCCSVISDQDTLDFLDSLGPKFRTLADVCTNKAERGQQ
ncbi:desmocollin 2 like [Astyanax mexicanus]|uniref:desmocollin 2 like n=1 Tax=Astyanax mexicanus TaxID=7994 RepID=UPI0020CA9E4D|nr:desmocollin 2 like [Astyanax mexicanus]